VSTTNRPPIWQLIRDAVAPLARETTNAEIKQLLLRAYPDLNEATIACQIAICAVNRVGRVNYPENKKPRLANGPYDFLFATNRGKVAWYGPDKHGMWSIEQTLPTSNRLAVRRVDETTEAVMAPQDIDAAEPLDDGFGGGAFALESHLRDYLARNPPSFTYSPIRLCNGFSRVTAMPRRSQSVRKNFIMKTCTRSKAVAGSSASIAARMYFAAAAKSNALTLAVKASASGTRLLSFSRATIASTAARSCGSSGKHRNSSPHSISAASARATKWSDSSSQNARIRLALDVPLNWYFSS